MPPDAGETQRIETRRGFYAGAFALLTVIMDRLTPGEDPQDEDIELMESLHKELTDFSQSVKAGKA